MDWNLRILLFNSFLLLQLTTPSLGAIEKPSLQPVSEPQPEGVEVIPEANANSKILVLENIPRNQDGSFEFKLAKIMVTDPSESVSITLVAPPPPEDLFAVISENNEWFFVIVKTLDAEADITKYLVRLAQGSSTENIEVEIQDENDNPVQIDGTEPPNQNLEIEEFKAQSAPIIKILASDKDAMDAGKITFELRALIGNADNFNIDGDGSLYLVGELDYQKNSMHRLLISVFDSNKDEAGDSIIITIDVIDIPNLAPEWTNLPSIRDVPEDTPVDELIETVTARDGDLGVNWPIEYSLIEEHPVSGIAPYLTINKTTGAISVIRVIDAEELFDLTDGLSITLNLTAKEIAPDGEQALELATVGTIVLNIKDVNDNSPEICESTEPSPTAPCKTAETFSVTIPEESTGTLNLDKAFIVRDLDPTLQFAKYIAAFAPGTPQVILDALEIQPTRESSAITEYSIAIKDPSKLDYEGGFDFSDPVSFTIIITESNIPSNIATATIQLTVTDKNDESPVFYLEDGSLAVEYEFYVCENSENGAALKKVAPDDPEKPICPAGQADGVELQIIARDADVSVNFNTVRYRWYSSSRAPPLIIDPVSGKMTVNSDPNFDFERFTEDIYIVEAYDNPENPNDQRVSSIPVRFKVLDVNDVPVDLKVPTGRPDVNESYVTGDLVLEFIVAEDVDLDADIQLSLSVNTLFTKSKIDPSGFIEIDSIDDDIKEWFELEIVDDTSINQKTARIVIGSKSPDREGAGEREIDRVDLTITAEDRKTVTGERYITQLLTIMIIDVNDESPYWEDVVGDEPVRETVLETEAFTDGEDTSTDTQREIHTFRVRDPDKVTNFQFSYRVKGCSQTVEICDEMEQLVELDAGTDDTIGRAILRRRKDVQIDREEQKFYGRDTDELIYTLTVSDGVEGHEASVDIIITVEDINDNTPEWDKEYNAIPYSVREDVPTPIEIVKFHADDADKSDGKYGIVNYRIIDSDSPNNGVDMFDINVDTGSLTAIPGAYNWSSVAQYSVTVQAIDYYRPSSSNSGSNRNETTIIINVIDANDNNPEFLTNPTLPLITVNEDVPKIDEPLPGMVLIRDIDDPSTGNAQFTAEIIKVVKDPDLETALEPKPFKAGNLLPVEGSSENYKNAQVVPTQEFTDKWGVYYITFKATDKGEPNTRSAEETYKVVIENVNRYAPEFEYPATDNSTRILISVAAQPGRLVTWNNDPVDPIKATDKDDGTIGNGQIVYSIRTNAEDDDDGSSFFNIPNANTGEIYLSKPLDNPNAKLYRVTIVASDLGDPQLSATTFMTMVIVPTSNRPPLFPNTDALNMTIQETNLTSVETGIREATDPDSDLGDEYPELGPQTVYYHVVGGSVDYFEAEPDKPVIRNTQALDRETIDFHQLVIYVSNSETPPAATTPPDQVDPENPSFLLINIEIGDEYDTPPQFTRDIISGGIAPSSSPGDNITIIYVTDLDLDDEISFEITSAVIPSDPSLPGASTTPLTLEKLSNNSAVLKLQFAPQGSFQGYYTFQITATDLGTIQTSIQCKIYIIKDSHFIVFRFVNKLSYVQEREDELADILTNAFKYRCNIDKSTENLENPVNKTDVKAHFIDLNSNEPVLGTLIYEKQFDPDVSTILMPNLTAAGFILDGLNDNSSTATEDKLVTYLLMAGIGILAVVLIVLTVSCFFTNRSLNRRVRALTATTFGSQVSGLNRTGAALDLPNTNEFAIEGSNPFWTTNPSEKKSPVFDTESIGSGGSVLIGVEDDEDFKNYKSTNNPLFENNNNDMNNMGQGDLSDDDLYGNGNNAKEYTYDSDSNPDPEDDAVVDSNFTFGGGEDEGNNMDDTGYPGGNGDEEVLTDLPMPNTTRRNPLMNMGFQDDDD